LEVQLATSPIGYVCVELGRGEIGMTEHFLDAPQVGASFEEVCGERVAEQVGVDPLGVEPGLRRERRRMKNAPARVSAPPWALRKSSGRWRRSRWGGRGRGTGGRPRRLPADRDDPLLVALAHAAHEAIVERNPSLFEGDGFRNA
jgi:hypothetical protein